MWFLFKILHVRGRNTCLCEGELCFIMLGEVFTSFVVIGASFSFFTCVVSSLSLYTCFLMYTIFIFVSHMMP